MRFGDNDRVNWAHVCTNDANRLSGNQVLPMFLPILIKLTMLLKQSTKYTLENNIIVYGDGEYQFYQYTNRMERVIRMITFFQTRLIIKIRRTNEERRCYISQGILEKGHACLGKREISWKSLATHIPIFHADAFKWRPALSGWILARIIVKHPLVPACALPRSITISTASNMICGEGGKSAWLMRFMWTRVKASIAGFRWMVGNCGRSRWFDLPQAGKLNVWWAAKRKLGRRN